MTSLVLSVDERLGRHLARAVAEHLRWCRRNAVAAPAELSSLLAALSDCGGQQRSDEREDDTLGDGVCVSYQTAARLLDVSERTVRRMCADGRLSALPVGRRRVIPVFELRRFSGAA